MKIHKEIVEDKKTITVPIRREEMVIEAGSEDELRIPLKEEEIEISKHPVQLNEVTIKKQQIEDVQHIKENVKKEIAVVETEGNAEVIEKEEQ
ncbi:YsnF/AvaK domain-containing protein [Alkalihalophilus pseudofirmus]|uniref:YsnF/AvaK domain-containing protein n=1 Tax=Alkalihalophilus pseudofirmus TaxID=79885 RepID=UPI001EE3EA44